MTIVLNTDLQETVKNKNAMALGDANKANPLVAEIKGSISLEDTISIINLGVDVEGDLGSFVDQILSEARADTMSVQMDKLGGVIDEIKSVDISRVKESSFFAKLPIIGDRIAYSFGQMAMKFDTVNDRIERVIEVVKTEMSVGDHSIVLLDELYTKYLSLIDGYELYIAAGEQKLGEVFEGKYKELQAQAEASGDIRDIESFNSYQSQVVRLNKRITTMKTIRHMAVESIPVIRALQSNLLQFKEDFNDVIMTVVPMWKRQFLLAIEANKQGKMAKVSTSVKDFSNQQYLDFKHQMLALEGGVTEALSRGVIDASTLVRSSELTCQAIEEHKNRLKLTYENQKATASAIVDGQEKLKKALLVEVRNV